MLKYLYTTLFVLAGSFVLAVDLNLYDKSHAVLIGINNYQNEDITDLGYAVEDAKNVARMLESKLGFDKQNIHILLDEDATLSNIKNTLFEIALNVDENDRLLIFYAGHGETINLRKGGELGYLVPVDASLDNLYASGLSMKTIKEISDITPAKHTLFMIDACYGGVMTVGTRGLKKNEFSDEEKYLKKITSEPASQIITAGGKGEKAQERAEWGSSAFTKELLAGIEDGLADADYDGYITADELSSFLSKRVFITSEENQTPVSGRYGSGEGEFVFINPVYVEEIAKENEEEIDKEENVSAAEIGSGISLKGINDLMRDNSEIKNMLQFNAYNKGKSTDDISNFEQSASIDSSFIDLFQTGGRSQPDFFKYIFPRFEFQNIAFMGSYIPVYLNATRSSGYEYGIMLAFGQLDPLNFRFMYTPIYNTDLKRTFHFAELERHPYGLKSTTIKIIYEDKVVSNDQWMRDESNNYATTILFGQDYMDHFIRKGFTFSYNQDFSSRLRGYLKFNNSFQTTKGLDYSMDWTDYTNWESSSKNRPNFIVESGRHSLIDVGFSYNSMSEIKSKSFKFELEIEDSTKIEDPIVYLIAESPGWPSKKIEMSLSSRDDLLKRFEDEESDDCDKDYCIKLEKRSDLTYDIMMIDNIELNSINMKFQQLGSLRFELNKLDFKHVIHSSNPLESNDIILTFNTTNNSDYTLHPVYSRLGTLTINDDEGFCISGYVQTRATLRPDKDQEWGGYACDIEMEKVDDLVQDKEDLDENINQISTLIENTENETSPISSTDTEEVTEIDSVFRTNFIFKVDVSLPPGTHAYRFLVDSTSYKLDPKADRRMNTSGKIVSIVELDNPYRFDVAYEYADTKIGSDFSYQRIRFKYATVFPLSSFETIHFSILGGLGKKVLPSQKLYYIGGGSTVRGFSYIDTKKYSGSNMLLSKMEYHLHWFSSYIFYDVGFVADDIDFSNPISSYGIALSVDDLREVGTSDGFFTDTNFIFYRSESYTGKTFGVEVISQYSLRDFELDHFLP